MQWRARYLVLSILRGAVSLLCLPNWQTYDEDLAKDIERMKDVLECERPWSTNILRHTMMCRSNGSLFHKKFLNMGPIKNIPKHSSIFSKNIFWGVFDIWNFWKWAFILRKIPKNGYPFHLKWHLKMDMGFKAQVTHPCPNPFWVPLSPKTNTPRGKNCYQQMLAFAIKEIVHTDKVW